MAHKPVYKRTFASRGRRLTTRSSGAPTAGHQARSGGTQYILARPGLASCRYRPLSSNVRPRRTALPRQQCVEVGLPHENARFVQPATGSEETEAAEMHAAPEGPANTNAGTGFARANAVSGLASGERAWRSDERRMAPQRVNSAANLPRSKNACALPQIRWRSYGIQICSSSSAFGHRVHFMAWHAKQLPSFSSHRPVTSAA